MAQETVIPTPEENTQNMDITLRRKLEKMLTELYSLSSVITGAGELIGILTVTPPSGEIQFPAFTASTVLGINGDGAVVSTGILTADLTAIMNVIDGAPAALDTLNELAAALGDDANFASTVTTALAAKAPLAGPTFTGVVAMANGTAGAPSLHLGDSTSGFYRSALNCISLATAGTGRWTVNASGHLLAVTDNSFDIGASGATRPRNLYLAGSISVAGGILSSNSIRVNATDAFYWDTRGFIRASADGVFKLADAAETSFSRLQFGGTTSGFPALKRSSATLQCRLADDSGDADFLAAYFRASTGYVVGATQVVGAQGAAVADAADEANAVIQLNTLLARLRTHGLIAT